jgi:hypothetical protein
MTAETNADGRVELLSIDQTGKLSHRWEQTAGNGNYVAWTDLNN